MNKFNMLTFIHINGYGGTRGLIILIAIYAYVGWPIKPWMPTSLELQEVSGIPVFQTAATLQSTDTYLLINKVRLNCFYSALDGRNGCEQCSEAIDVRAPVRASYFWMSTRFGHGYRMIHALEQDGRLVISSQQSYEMRLRSYRTGWKIYFQLLAFLSIVAIIVLFFENNIKKSSNPKE